MAKLKTRVGVYRGIMDSKDGRLLLRRREEAGSILPGTSFLGNWELPGGGAEEHDKPPYDHFLREANREVNEEVGIVLFHDPLTPCHSTSIRLGDDYDDARVYPIVLENVETTKGIVLWVSTEELNELARNFVSPKEARERGLSGASGIVSGWGKRMHCLALYTLLHSPNQIYAQQARETLEEISRNW